MRSFRRFALAVFGMQALLGCGQVSNEVTANDGGSRADAAGEGSSDGGANARGAAGASSAGAIGGGAGTAQGEDPGPDALPWKSGSRLRARVWDGGDGAQLFIDWFDTMLGIPCTFAKGPEGVEYCMPALGSVQYCPPDRDYDSREPHYDFSRFVAAVERIDLSTRPLSARILFGEDGSRENAGLFDVAHGTPCMPLPDQAATCLPPHSAIVYPEQPSSCPYFDVDCSACPRAGFAWRGVEPWESVIGCESVVDTFTFLPASANAFECLGLHSHCANVAVSDKTYAKTSIKRWGTGKLRAEFYVDSAGRPVRNIKPPSGRTDEPGTLFRRPHPGFFDENLKIACGPPEASQQGGKARCVPFAYVEVRDASNEWQCASLGFADSECSIPIILSDGCGSPVCDERFWAVISDQVYEAGPELDLRHAYHQTPSGECESQGIDRIFVTAFSTIGPAMPLASLPSVSAYTE